MILLRGLPLEFSPDDLRLAYWGIGAHLGTAVSQSGRDVTQLRALRTTTGGKPA